MVTYDNILLYNIMRIQLLRFNFYCHNNVSIKLPGKYSSIWKITDIL